MKPRIIILSSFNRSIGYGNFIRSSNFLNFLKKKYSCEMYVKTNKQNLKKLNKINKNFKILNFKEITKYKKEFFFLDMPNIKKNEFRHLKDKKLVCYGNNNFYDHKKIIVPFKDNKKNSSIFYSIIKENFSYIRYFSKEKLIFFIYMSTQYKKKLLIKIVKIIRKYFNNKIIIFSGSKKVKFFKKEKKIKIINNINKNYLKNNLIYIGNIGSGGVDRAISGTISFVFSKNESEKKIYKSVKNSHKNLFYFGDQIKFNFTKFNKQIKNLNNLAYPFKPKPAKKFLKNNLKLERKVISLYKNYNE